MASQSGLDQYLAELANFPPMTAEAEQVVARRMTAGDSGARDELITRNIRFVVKIAKKYRGHGLSLEDLIGEGNFGLVRAADRFDPDKGVRFVSYAVHWIRQSILLALACQGKNLGLPASRASDLYRLRKAEAEFRAEFGREATDAEVSGKIDLSPQIVGALRAAHDAPTIELDMDPSNPESTANRDKISIANEIGDMEDRVEARLRREYIERAFAQLPKRDADILRLYFGTSGGREYTLEEIAQVTGVTRERVRQIRDRAIEQIRADAAQLNLKLDTRRD
jgi:RNA polymerase primary sigma factor